MADPHALTKHLLIASDPPQEQKRKKKADDDTVDLDDLKVWLKLVGSLLQGNGEQYQVEGEDGPLLTLQELKEWVRPADVACLAAVWSLLIAIAADQIRLPLSVCVCTPVSCVFRVLSSCLLCDLVFLNGVVLVRWM